MSPPTPRHRWFRYSLRTLFVLVTVCAIVLGLWMRHQRLETLARFHEQLLLKSNSAVLQADWDEIGTEPWKALVQESQENMAWHQAMLLKYRRAKWRPWVQWETDPDPPPGYQPASDPS